MTAPIISKRVTDITASKSIGLSSLVAELRREGKKIISLSIGETDLETPKEIKEATNKALNENQTRYDLVPGIVELRDIIIKKFNAETGLNYTRDNVQLANGSKQNLYNIFQTLLDEGSEVIVPIPYWVTFPESIKLAGGKAVFIDCKENLEPDLEQIKKSITPKTRAIIINSPNNPTGKVFSESTILELLKITIENNLTLISDEAYESLIFDGVTFPCPHRIAAKYFPKEINRVITVRTFSKSHSMTGFRIGYSIGDTGFTTALNKLQSHLTGNNCTFAQYGALAAMNLGDDYHNEFKTIMQRRRDLAYDLCKKIFPKTQKPEGAFYLFCDIRDFLGTQFKTDNDLCEFFLKEAGVAVLPGSAFGLDGFLRISFAGSESDIENGLKQMAKALGK